MLVIKSFIFSDFKENTYVLHHPETQQAVVIDPGCYTQAEKDQLGNYIESNKLTISKLLLTHGHLDHVFGCAYMKRKFGMDIYLHPLDTPLFDEVPARSAHWGFPAFEPSAVDAYLAAGDVIAVGGSELAVVHVPGHAPGHVAFICHAQRFVIGGDVLFKGSVGRTDFPRCSHPDLMKSIETQFMTLPDDYTVYSGHGQPTTIGRERATNPFLR